MRISYLDPQAVSTDIDQPLYSRFCIGQGIPQEELDALEIRFVPEITGQPQTKALFQGKRGACVVQLRTGDERRRYNTAVLNHYLLHETCHFIDFCRNGRCYASGEAAMPYDERPSETKAIAFAKHHKRECCFVTQQTVLRSAVGRRDEVFSYPE